jgi:hypothetical protein
LSQFVNANVRGVCLAESEYYCGVVIWLRAFRRAARLAFARGVDGLAEDACGFLRRMKARGIFSFDKIEKELSLALGVSALVLAPNAFLLTL